MANKLTAEEGRFTIQPVKTWGGLLTILSAVAIIVTGINQAVNWFDSNVQKVSTTNMQLMQIRTEIKSEIEKLKEEDHKRDLENKRRDAWALVNQLEIKSLVIQFRLNECQVRNEEKKPTALEKQICDQYRQEKEEAQNRYKEAWREAMNASKEK